MDQMDYSTSVQELPAVRKIFADELAKLRVCYETAEWRCLKA